MVENEGLFIGFALMLKYVDMLGASIDYNWVYFLTIQNSVMGQDRIRMVFVEFNFNIAVDLSLGSTST